MIKKTSSDVIYIQTSSVSSDLLFSDASNIFHDRWASLSVKRGRSEELSIPDYFHKGENSRE